MPDGNWRCMSIAERLEQNVGRQGGAVQQRGQIVGWPAHARPEDSIAGYGALLREHLRRKEA